MNKLRDIESVRDEAFRKLGRNILNLAKIEGGLKYFLTASQFQGNSQQVRQQLQEKYRQISKQSLGTLVEKFNRDTLVNQIVGEPKAKLKNQEISWSYKFSYDNIDFVKEQRSALRTVVAKRNKLIHQHLAVLDVTSVDDYTKLIGVLDEQNPRLLAHLEELRLHFQYLQECLQERFGEIREQIQSSNSTNAQED